MRKIIIPISVMIIAAIMYGYISTIEVYTTISNIYMKTDKYSPNYVDLIDEEIFNQIKRTIWGDNIQGNTKKLKLYLVFGINDIIKKGFAVMIYSFEVIDKNALTITGSKNIPITVSTIKTNGHWKIIKMYEAP